MKKLIITLFIIIPALLSSQSRNTVYLKIKPGVKDLALGKTLNEIRALIKKKYKLQMGNDNVNIFNNFHTMKDFILKYAPSIAGLRSYRNWKYSKFEKFVNKSPYKSFVKIVSRLTWLTSEYPVKFKRWKKYRIMLENFNPFVRRVDFAFYRNVLYYARFYIKDRYRFNDTYLPQNEKRFMMHLYVKFKRMYGQPILFNNYEYHWRDKKVELSLNGKNSTLTFIDFKIDKNVVRYLKNVAIVLSKMQAELSRQSDYVDHYLQDF